MRIIKTAQYHDHASHVPHHGDEAEGSELGQVGDLDLHNLHMDSKDVDVHPTDGGTEIEISGDGHMDANPDAHGGGSIGDLLDGLGSDFGAGAGDDMDLSVHADPDMDPAASEHGHEGFGHDEGLGLDLNIDGHDLGHLDVGGDLDGLGDEHFGDMHDDVGEFDDDQGLFGGDDLDDSLGGDQTDDDDTHEEHKGHGGDGLGGYGGMGDDLDMGGYGPAQPLL